MPNVCIHRRATAGEARCSTPVQCGVGQAGIAGRLVNGGSRLAVHDRNLHRERSARQRRSHGSGRAERALVHRLGGAPNAEGREASDSWHGRPQGGAGGSPRSDSAAARQRLARSTRCEQTARYEGRDFAEHLSKHAVIKNTPAFECARCATPNVGVHLLAEAGEARCSQSGATTGYAEPSPKAQR